MTPHFLGSRYNFCPKCGAKMINPRGTRCDKASRECHYKNKYGVREMHCDHMRGNNCALLMNDGEKYDATGMV